MVFVACLRHTYLVAMIKVDTSLVAVVCPHRQADKPPLHLALAVTVASQHQSSAIGGLARATGCVWFRAAHCREGCTLLKAGKIASVQVTRSVGHTVSLQRG